MLLIVAHHFVVNSGVMQIMDAQPTTLHSVALYLEGMWGKTGINCFVLITGWFMCKSHITARKFFKLLLEVLFYSIIINAIFWVTGYHEYNIGSYLMFLWPFWNISDNFVGCYLIFFMFIPFLNILTSNMTKRQHLLLVVLCLSVYTIIPTMPLMNISFNYMTWFSILYIFSSYMRKYSFPHKTDLPFWIKTTALCVLLAMGSVVIMLYLGQINRVFYLVSDSNRVLAVATGISSFMMFVNIKIPQNKFINTIAASTFGVLLIHANSDVMRQWLWKDICDVSGHYSSPYFWLYIIIVPIMVFTACILIDHLRLRYLERPVVDYTTKLYEDYKAKWNNRATKTI